MLNPLANDYSYASEADFTSPILDNPSSVIGLLFGQNVVFVNLDVGFLSNFNFNESLGTLNFLPGLFQAALSLNLTGTVGFGLQAEYDFDRT